MKSVFATIAILALLTTATKAQAYTVTCYDNYNQTQGPVVQATIVSNTTIKNVIARSENHPELAGTPGVVTGTMVVSNHSPYQGDIQYNLPNGMVLLLPAQLSNMALMTVLNNGIGYQAGENGVIIGWSEDDDSDAGSHFSIRLTCQSDK